LARLVSYLCPVCQRTFGEPGFCPFDGKPLDESRAHRAPSDAETQVVESRTEPGTGIERGPRKVRAVSATENRAEAIEAFRGGLDDYDRLIGQTLDGRYQVLRKLGEGGMGVVFAVKHAVIERPLAIKVLKREVMRDTATTQRFIQEARAASRIGHPNIVDVTDFGQTADGMTYSVMELVDGTTLAKAIKQVAPLPADRAVRIAIQIARALAAAHDKGIVHRDLKPENVFLIDRDGRPDFVKIVDFGIAKVQPIEGTSAGPKLTKAGAVFGTPEYMAPEQASGRGDTDHRVDIYALGTILYQMLVGKVPLKGESMIRTIAMQMLDPIVPPREARPDLGISPAIETVVMRALAKKREDRYQTMAELMTALEQAGTQATATSPTVVLSPLPPGADPTLLASSVPSPTVDGPVATPSPTAPQPAEAPPRRKKPETRQLHEPEFVADKPRSFDHVFDEPPPPERSNRWPMLIAGLIVLGIGAGGAVLIASKLRAVSPVAAGEQRDAALDDGLRVAEPGDAGVPEPLDALVIAELPRDAGTRALARDAGASGIGPGPGPGPVPDRNRLVTIEVLTRPGDADVFIGHNFRGPGGVRITERYGTRRKIECKTERMKGSVDVVFDGTRQAVMCTATRARFCVAGLKNPYDDCEEDPNAGP
jgi:serine/threonine protein kinase